jgi:hypothetical protein
MQRELDRACRQVDTLQRSSRAKRAGLLASGLILCGAAALTLGTTAVLPSDRGVFKAFGPGGFEYVMGLK